MKLLKHSLITLTLALLASAASAGTFSINAWTNDTSSGIVAGQTVWAYHFGVTNVATVNGVTVPGIGTNGNPSVAGQFSVSGIPFVFLNDNNLLTALGGSGSAVMAKNFLYGGTPGLITVQGLTTGQVYTVSIYGVSFDPPAARASNFTNGTDTIYVNENASPTRIGVRVDYTFTATATTNLTIVMPTNANTFHTYGLALRQPLRVTTNSDAGPGSLRQAVLDAATIPGADTITFAPTLSGQTITLTSQIGLDSNVTLDAGSLPGGVTVSGGNATRIFLVNGVQPVSLLGLTLTGGHAYEGGAIRNESGTTTLTRCTLSNNSADYGGAIHNLFGTLTLTHCTLTGNSALESGAIANNSSTLTMTHCTLALNRATGAGDGGGAIGTYGGSTLTMTACIIAGNTSASGAGPDLWKLSGTLNATNCIVGDGTTSTLVSGPNGNQVGTTVSPINALFAPLGNYGGSTQTMPPLPGSPAIDAASVIAGLTTDQRGSARNVGAAPDIGAVESGGLWVQNNLNSGANSLRDVIANSASITNSKTVLFTTNLSGATITLASEIALTNGVTIDATSLPGGITVSGGNATRIFQVDSGPTVFLLGLTFTGGNSTGGGAIRNSLGQVTLTHCTFSNNSTVAGGGAIRNDAGTLTLTDCTLSGNSANYGGAIGSGTTLTLTHCTIALNHSIGTTPGFDGGGGIDNFNNVPLTLTACILAGNTTVTGSGPDLWMEGGTLNATNCLIGDGTNSFITNGVNGNLVGTSGSPINALLAPLGNYGGSTKTMPPLPGSPAINAAGASSFTTDQRGYPRPVGLAADIGAVEGIYNAAGPGKITNLTRLPDGSIRFSLPSLTNASFPVFATTNVNQPSSNWTQIGFATETSSGTGLIQFTDPEAANYPQRFYRVKSP